MEIPSFVIVGMFTAILGLQAWILSGIVNLKERVAALEAVGKFRK